jgi:hypothetical protein
VITAIQMVTDAFRLANIIDQIQAPSAEQAQSGLRALNQMLADWEVDGIRLGWAVTTDLDANLPLLEQDERGVKYNLAVEICGDYGISPLPEVSERAASTFARFAKSSSDEVVADLSGLPGEEAPYTVSWPLP